MLEIFSKFLNPKLLLNSIFPIMILLICLSLISSFMCTKYALKFKNYVVSNICIGSSKREIKTILVIYIWFNNDFIEKIESTTKKENGL